MLEDRGGRSDACDGAVAVGVEWRMFGYYSECKGLPEGEKRPMGVDLFRDQEGFTTVGIAVAILLAIALLFSSAHVYEVNSCAAEIQEVADASALAAASVTAEFMIAVALCDAVVLSFSLTSLLCTGVGAVALCVPGGQGLGGRLVDTGSDVLSARNSFARKVSQGLNQLQEALPFLCALNAAAVASANNGETNRYVAVAVPVPFEGEPIVVGGAAACGEYADATRENADSLADQAARAEEAASEAVEAKMRGFMADCGASPDYCMYQRAGSVGGLPAANNPLYHSADTWSFSVALERARAYYAYRSVHEVAIDSTVEQRANAELRRIFYRHAAEQLREGYVHDDEAGFSAYFPIMFSKTSELRESSLYRQELFPVTDDGAAKVMHAFDDCPKAEGWRARGSVAQLEEGGYATCPECEFTAASLGDVAAASSRIDNGFEYHYRLVAQAANDYQRARQSLDPASAEAKETFSSLLDGLRDALSEIAGFRISADPPGGKGCVAFVVNLASGPLPSRFVSPFASTDAQMGLRVAVSGALLQEDPATDGDGVIASLTDRIDTSAPLAGAGKMVLDCWSGLLSAYGDGQNALLEGVEGLLDGIPLAGGSGLGSWARSGLEEALEAAGLQPANLSALKPVLASAGAVTEGDSGAFSVEFRQLQQLALRGSSPTGTVLDGLLAGVQSGAFDALDVVDGGITVAMFTVPIVDAQVPVTIALPPSVSDGARSWVERAAETLRSLVSSAESERIWQ